MPNIPTGAELPRVFLDNQPTRPDLVARPMPLVPPPPSGPSAGAAVGAEKRKADRRQRNLAVVADRRHDDRRNRKRHPGDDHRGRHISVKV